MQKQKSIIFKGDGVIIFQPRSYAELHRVNHGAK